MFYLPTQQDIYILKQHKMNLYIIINLLNFPSLKTVGNLQGELISDTFSIDADSDIRRTFHLTCFVKDSSFYIDSSSKIWIDKLIEIQIGIKDQRTSEIVYYKMGSFLFDEVGYQYDATSKTLTLSCVDLMANFTGLRNGQVRGLATIINRGEDIREVMIQILTDNAQYNKYRIDERQRIKTLQHDLNFSVGATIYDVLHELNEHEAGWEMFFDINNFFVSQKIPSTYGDPYVLDWQTLDDLIISESINTKFSDIKNSVRVWGRSLDANRTIDEGTITNTGSTYEGVLETVVPNSSGKIPQGTTIAFVPNINSGNNPRLKITDQKGNPQTNNDGTIAYQTYIIDGALVVQDNEAESGYSPLPVGRLRAGTGYVVRCRYDENTPYFVLMGQTQVVYVAKLYQEDLTAGDKATDIVDEETNNILYVINPANPFGIDAIGEIRQVFEGGEYEKIYTDELAKERAEYELWRATNLNYELVLRMKPVLWLDVNQKIEYKSKLTGEIEQYIIKTIDGSSVSGEMTVKAIKFYPEEPFIVS